MELIEIFFIFVAGFMAGEIYHAFKVSKLLRELAESEGISLNKSDEESTEIPERQVSAFKVEKINDSLYMWDHENTFMCQANTIEELATFTKENNIKYAAVLYNNEKFFAFIDGAVSKIK